MYQNVHWRGNEFESGWGAHVQRKVREQILVAPLHSTITLWWALPWWSVHFGQLIVCCSSTDGAVRAKPFIKVRARSPCGLWSRRHLTCMWWAFFVPFLLVRHPHYELSPQYWPSILTVSCRSWVTRPGQSSSSFTVYSRHCWTIVGIKWTFFRQLVRYFNLIRINVGLFWLCTQTVRLNQTPLFEYH